jgi:hypothetical protein
MPMFIPYAPRPIRFLGIETIQGFRLKVYSIHLPEAEFDRSRFAPAWELAASALPQPASNPERPGLGFAILHQGRTGDYFILGWWDRENELPVRIFLRDETGWRSGRESESFCVWDLQVIWSEREAYVQTVLKDGDVEDYLARRVAEG